MFTHYIILYDNADNSTADPHYVPILWDSSLTLSMCCITEICLTFTIG